MLICPSLCLWTVYQCHGACVEVDSDTEAVAGRGFKLGCISCKKRSEVDGVATVEWYFRAKGEADFVHVSDSLSLLKCIYNVKPAHDAHDATHYGLQEILCASSGILVPASATSNTSYLYMRRPSSLSLSLSLPLSHVHTSSYTSWGSLGNNWDILRNRDHWSSKMTHGWILYRRMWYRSSILIILICEDAF